MIKLSRLNKYFFRKKKNEIHVLNDVSLDIGEKGLVVIKGASGSGKTTLLNVLGGLDSIYSGEIDFFEHHLSKYDAKVWDNIRNEHIGYIFQNYYLLPELSVYENIRFVLKILGITDEAYIESRVNYVLKAVGMYPFRKKKALQLSGGQQQRVAIARALVKNPKVVIADEPTGNLDSKNTTEIMNIIKEISKDKLVVLVTHEQSIASVYGDRIIEFENGQIVNEIINDPQVINEHFEDDAIYLKDKKVQQTLEGQNATLSLYLDETEEQPIDIKLIVKNKTVYLDVSSQYDKVRIIDKQSGIVVKDEHYQPKTKEETLHTTFKTDDIDHSLIEKDKRLVLSFKQTFKMAFEKLLQTSRRGKLMIASFFFAGTIIALAIATLATFLFVRPESFIHLPKGYVTFSADLRYDQLSVLADEDSSVYINPYGTQVMYLLNNDGSRGIRLISTVDISDHAKNYKLTTGKFAEKDSELVVTTGMLKQFLNSEQSQDFGIWNVNNLFKETIDFGNIGAKIVGVVDLETPIVFGSQVFLSYISSEQSYAVIEAYEDVLTYGALPEGSEVVYSEAFVKSVLMVAELDSTMFPFEHLNIVVSGTHNLEQELLTLVTSDFLYRNFVDENYGKYIYSSDPDKLIERIKYHFGYGAKDIYATARQDRIALQKMELIAALTTSSILIAFSLIGFYFVVRSSMIGRIYEVSVYRALGVKRKDIFRSFLVEIFVLTTISTLIGYFFMTLIFARLQRGLFGELNFFYVHPISTFIGALIVYLLNFAAGMIPIYFLLRKTPAQILSQYDI